MALSFDMQSIRPLQRELEQHPVYAALHGVDDLRYFMQHHVYSVWDFMSLIKYLQARIAPAAYPWVPRSDGSVRRFINELVMEEESDQGLPGTNGFSSHFELYCQAMREIGADAETPLRFVEEVRAHGIGPALALDFVPEPARRFTTATFAFIESGQPHRVAAALALGREHVIPGMFRAFLARMRISQQDAPAFHYYLNRHIHLDEDFHAPLSLRLLEELCGNDAEKLAEAEQAAQHALQARIAFWDGVLEAIRAKA
jgi:hypothetical protein